MATVTYRYGGRKGKAYRLTEDDSLLVVRTQATKALVETALTVRGRRALRAFEPVARFAEAGVDVLRCRATKGRRALRDTARRELTKEKGIRFAGRVLSDPRSSEPVVYTENLFVKFGDGVKPSACRRILKEHGVEVKRTLEYARNAFFVGAEEGCGRTVFTIASSLLDDDSVELCHPELIRRVRERAVAFPLQWHLEKKTINGTVVDQHASVTSAWALSQGEGVTIAIIDSGTDVDHLEFGGANKIVAPRDVTRGTNDPRPRFANEDHGTACSGVACANGTHGASGVAPRAKLMPIRLMSGLGSQAEADAFVWAANHGADVISCSWGPQDGDFLDPQDPLHDHVEPLPDSTRTAIEFAVEQGRNGKGCVITWAAGNGDESVDNDGYASFDKVIAVAACDDTGKKAPYSDHGEANWCAFPSNHFFLSHTEGIWTTDRSGTAGYNPGDPDHGDTAGHYTNSFGGTSSACPGAAGVAALVLGRNPDLRWDEVKEIFRQSCDRIDPAGGNYDAQGHSTKYGYGRLNAETAVDLALPAQPTYTTVHWAIQDVAIEDLETARLAVAVGDTKAIQDIRITVEIEHTWIGDLVVKIKPPAAMGAATVTLHDGAGGSTNNLKRTYDTTSTPGLADYLGLSPTGTWKLEVRDTQQQDVGKIIAFAVEADL